MSELNDVPSDDGCVDEELEQQIHDELVDFTDIQRDDRQWIRTIGALTQSVSVAARVEGTHNRVQLVINDMMIAACERAARIFRSDLPQIDVDD